MGSSVLVIIGLVLLVLLVLVVGVVVIAVVLNSKKKSKRQRAAAAQQQGYPAPGQQQPDPQAQAYPAGYQAQQSPHQAPGVDHGQWRDVAHGQSSLSVPSAGGTWQSQQAPQQAQAAGAHETPADEQSHEGPAESR